MDYQLIACDIDETLYENGTIAEVNLKAIEAFRKQGGKFVVATGRPAFTLQALLEELNLYGQPEEYLLANNGALILSCEDMKVISKTALSTSLVHDLFDFGKQFDVCIQVFTAEHLYVYHLNKEEEQRLQYFGVKEVRILDDFNEVENQEIIKMIFEHRDVAYLKEIEQMMPTQWKEALSLSYSSNRYMELNAFGVSKGDALKQLVELLHIKQEATIAIGDNENDLSMVAFAGLGVCVENGQPVLKKIADVITKNSAKQGAVAEIIESYCLNK